MGLSELVRTATPEQPDVGSWAPYAGVLVLVGLLVAVAVVWLLRGRSARHDRHHRP